MPPTSTSETFIEDGWDNAEAEKNHKLMVKSQIRKAKAAQPSSAQPSPAEHSQPRRIPARSEPAKLCATPLLASEEESNIPKRWTEPTLEREWKRARERAVATDLLADTGVKEMVIRSTSQYSHMTKEELAENFDGVGTGPIATSVASFIIGNAMLTIPFTFIEHGWAALMYNIAAVLVMLFTALLLGYTLPKLEKDIKDPDFGDLGATAFGPGFRSITAGLQACECFLGGAVLMFVMVGQQLSELLQWNLSTVILWCVPATFLLSIAPKSFDFAFAHLRNLTMGCVLAAVVISGLLLKPRDTSQSLAGPTGTMHLSGIATTFNLNSVAIGDHIVFPGIYHMSKSPKVFRRGILIGYMVYLALILILCSVCYMTFGASMRPIILTNLGKELDGTPSQYIPAWLSDVFNFALCLRGLLVVPAFLKPLLVRFHLEETDGASKCFSVRNSAATLLVLLLVACLSIYLAEHGTLVEALAGSMFKSFNAVIVPCLGYLLICKPGGIRKFLTLIGIILGLIWLVGGTADCIGRIVGPMTNNTHNMSTASL